MKIVFVCKVYPTSRPGGMGFVCQDRARGLAKLGHDVYVITTSRGGGRETIDDQGVTVCHCEGSQSDYSQEFAAACQYGVKLLSPDILHLDSFDNRRPWWRDVKVGRLGLTMHGFCWGAYFTQVNLLMRKEITLDKATFNIPQAMHERGYMLDFNTVIGISVHEHWMLRQLMGIDGAKLLYNPIPDYFYHRPTKLPRGPRRFLCAAVSGQMQRGFHYAQQAADQAGIELRVVRSVPRDEIAELLDICHGLVLPTAYAQGLDLAAGEAIARHRPVIATATGSYLREASGAYAGALRLVPLIDPVPALVGAMQGDLDVDWDNFQQPHRVAAHTHRWLELMQ